MEKSSRSSPSLNLMASSCFFSVEHNPIPTTSSRGDELALLAFRDAASPGGALASWNGSTGFCSWEGVTCSHGRNPPRVVALSLPKRGLAGTLSAAIGNLTFPVALELGFNALHGDVPASIGRLRRLRFLDLGYNAFSGEFPANLSSCIAMETMFLDNNNLRGRMLEISHSVSVNQHLLRLKNNSFTGPVPASLANMSSLNYLSLAINQFDSVIPPGLADITSLVFLDLSVNSLHGALPLSLYNLSSLRAFHVEGNWQHGNIPADVGSKFPAMEDFSLANNRFTGGIPSSISNLTNLTSLQLSLNGFAGLVPRDLGRLQRFQILYMPYNLLEANDRAGWEFITSLANCSQLLQLSLSQNSFHGQLPSSVVNLSATLQYLYLSDSSISGSIPQDISNLVGLSILDFSNTSISGVIPESIGKLSNLVQLVLYMTRLSGLIPTSLGNLTQLNQLIAHSANLEGPIPASLGKLRNLYLLDLSANYRLNGSIPKEVFLPSLSSSLKLSYNSLSGPLPSQIGNLVNLNQLILSGNQLSSQIPDTIGNYVVLESLLLDENMFEGSIPESLKNIKGLQILNLTGNNLSHGIPDALSSMGALQELYLAHNNLSGPIPTSLQKLMSLLAFDASFNNLQGQVPNSGVFRNLTARSITGNAELCDGIPQLRLPPCSTHPVSDREKQRSKSLVISLATTLAVLLLVLSVTVTIWKHKGRKSQAPPPAIIEEHFQRVSYQALLRGTNGFSEYNLLGKGRYGSVYRCTLEAEDTPVAVKVFDLQQSGSSKSFEAECEALRSVRHRCLIKIITCCSSIDDQGQDFKALVIDLMPNGSLDAWLHPKHSISTPDNTLSLAQRLDIAVHIMDALDYLHNHCQPLIVHCDVKPSNILLAEDMSARVGDFGISKILLESTSETRQNSSSTIGIRGSIGYVAPEYGEGAPISTLDVYSLGVLLLEMFTGRSPTDDMFKESLDLHKYSEAALPDRILEIADPTIWIHSDANDINTIGRVQECLASVIRIGTSCSKKQPKERMLIQDAAMEMHAIRDANLIFTSSLPMENEGEREADMWM
ncbi:unnamed protein product [Alopecurus aequalis]